MRWFRRARPSVLHPTTFPLQPVIAADPVDPRHRTGPVTVRGMDPDLAPPLVVDRWVQGGDESGDEITLERLRGRVVVLEAFQMLCPGCVTHALPQAKRIQQAFAPDDVTVIGLHTVFEHHEVTGPEALRVFLDEFRYQFPVAIAAHDDGESIPRTMRDYDMAGTPTTVLIDRSGRIRHRFFGALDDLRIGAHLGRLVAEQPASGA